MKKFLTFFIFFVILLGPKIPQANAAGIQVTVDGKPVHFSVNAPYVDENGRTMIPLRAVADALGCETTWGSDRQSATVEKFLTIEGQSVTLSQTFYPNDEDFCYQWVASATVGQKYLDFGLNDMNTKALVKNGSTYLPIRYVAEYFGYTVQWDGTSQTVRIQSGGKPGNGADRFALDGSVSGNMTLDKLCVSVWVSNGYRSSDTNIYIFSSDGTLTVEWANNAIPRQGNYLLQGDTVIVTTFGGERVEYFDFDSEENILVSRNGRKIVEQDYTDGYGNYVEAKTTREILKPYRENPYRSNPKEHEDNASGNTIQYHVVPAPARKASSADTIFTNGYDPKFNNLRVYEIRADKAPACRYSFALPVYDEYYSDDSALVLYSSDNYLFLEICTGAGLWHYLSYDIKNNSLKLLPLFHDTNAINDSYLIYNEFTYAVEFPGSIELYTMDGEFVTALAKDVYMSKTSNTERYVYYAYSDVEPSNYDHVTYRIWRYELATGNREELPSIVCCSIEEMGDGFIKYKTSWNGPVLTNNY